MNYYVSIDGTEVKGPYPLRELRIIVAENELPVAQVCAEGRDIWEPLLAVLTASEKNSASPVPTAPATISFDTPKKQYGPAPLFLSVLAAVVLGGSILMVFYAHFIRQKANEFISAPVVTK